MSVLDNASENSVRDALRPLRPPSIGCAAENTQDRILEILGRNPSFEWTETGVTACDYLDLAETIFRAVARWQSAHGSIVDPRHRAEWAQTTCRFASTGAHLLAHGRLSDHADGIRDAFAWSCRQLANGEGRSPDFWMRELAMAAWILDPHGTERQSTWRAEIRSIDPEKRNQFVFSKVPAEQIHNWAAYACAGEWIRERSGLGADGAYRWGGAFCDAYLPGQLARMTPRGLYRDPGHPMLYDTATRLQLATPLVFGYDGPLARELGDRLAGGALEQLPTLSPDGAFPYGGRSNQYHFNEALLCALGELEAVRYRASVPHLSRVFKRQAHLSARLIRNWLGRPSGLRHIKNAYPLESGFGCEDYGMPSVYLLLAASVLCQAALFADEGIGEAPTPSELGGFVHPTEDDFHKIFLCAGGNQVEIDTRGDGGYDANGIGRFQRSGVPAGLGLSTPFAPDPHYRLPPGCGIPRAAAIGPGWSLEGVDQHLADPMTVEEAILVGSSETGKEVAVDIDWVLEAGLGRVTAHCRLDGVGLCVQFTFSIPRASSFFVEVPVLAGDGHTEPVLSVNGDGAVLEDGAFRYLLKTSIGTWECRSEVLGNRNGVYRMLRVTAPPGATEIRLDLRLDGVAESSWSPDSPPRFG